MLGQNLQNVVGQIMDFYLAKTYKKVLPKTVGDNMNAYLAPDSPYFTSDYNTAVSYYKALQAKSQTK